MLRDAVENLLSYELFPLAWVFMRSVKNNFDFAVWDDVVFYPAI